MAKSYDKNAIHILFSPKSLAIIGASSTPMKGGNRILSNLIENHYDGKIYPINPKGGEFGGIEFKRSILEVEEPIDVAIIFIPNKYIPKALEECIQKGVKGAIIQAAGFEEVGEEGLILTEQIKKLTDNFSKIHIVGPNCTGLTRIDTNHSGFFSAFIVQYSYKRGNIGVISQSGMVNGGYLTYLGTRFPHMGFRYVASIGNKMDLDENDFLEYYIEDNTVEVIAIYIESFSDTRRFIELCRNARFKKQKPIILLKGGTSQSGQKATKSHTGSLAENTQLIGGLIRQANVIATSSFYELFDITRALSAMYSSNIKRPIKGTVGIITVSGGAGTVLADLIEKYDITIPKLSNETFKQFESIYPAWMPPNEFALMDLWPAIESSNIDSDGIHRKALDLLLNDEHIEGVLMTVFHTSSFPFDVDLIVDAQNKFKKPVFCWIFGDFNELNPLFEKLGQQNICCFNDLEAMVRAYKGIIEK